MVEVGSGGSASSSKNRGGRQRSAYGQGEDPQGRDEHERGDQRRHGPGYSGNNYNIGRTLDQVGPQAVPAILGASAGVLLGLFLGGRHHGLRGHMGSSGWLGGGRRNRRKSSSTIETDETAELIASNKVEGTAVFTRDGEKLGYIHNFMVGKRSGRVAYAVLNFGGILGVGGNFYPLPWNQLTYDTERGGYVVDLDNQRINEAPSFRPSEDPWSDPAYALRVSEFWSAHS